MTKRLRVLASPADDPSNPYIGLLYREVREHGVQVAGLSRRALVLERHDVIHVHWPEFLVRWAGLRTAVPDVVKVLTGLAVARARGAALIWTGHDLAPHDGAHPRLHRAYKGVFTRLVDLLISLGPASTDTLRAAYPALASTPAVVVPHGHYRDAYPAPPGRDEARHLLGLPTDPSVLILLGKIRPYKNVPELIHRFRATAPDGTLLAVVGEVGGSDTLGDEVQEAARGADNVIVRLGRASDDDVSAWHGAADVLVLPYSQASSLHSGVALLALTLGRPIVAPNSGTMRELQDRVGSQWVHLFDGGVDDALALAQAALEEDRGDAPDLSTLDWPELGRLTVGAYERAVQQRRGRPAV